MLVGVFELKSVCVCGAIICTPFFHFLRDRARYLWMCLLVCVCALLTKSNLISRIRRYTESCFHLDFIIYAAPRSATHEQNKLLTPPHHQSRSENPDRTQTGLARLMENSYVPTRGKGIHGVFSSGADCAQSSL